MFEFLSESDLESGMNNYGEIARACTCISKLCRTDFRHATYGKEPTDTWHVFILLGEWPHFDWSQISFILFLSPSFSIPLPSTPFFLFSSQRERSQPQTWIQTSDTHTHTQTERFMQLMLFMPHSAQNYSKPKGSTYTRHENLHKNKRRKRSIKEEKRKRRRRAAVGTALAPVTLSNCSLSLFLALCFQNTRVPQSLGTAASQILVLNDVRNMAFWRVTASTPLWRPTLAMRLRAQKHGTDSHWRLSIRRAGERKSCMCWLWIP